MNTHFAATVIGGYVVVVTFGLMLAGCGNSGDSDKADKTPDATVGLELPVFSSDDSSSDDAGGLPTTDAVAADVAATCPGGPGCSCSENGDCDAALCMETPAGNKCAASCVENCPAGYSCAQVPNGSDITTACVSRWARLCSPCNENQQCHHPGVDGGRCVSQGGAGAFCGAPCANDAHCPATHACKTAIDINGQTTKQCVPKSGSGTTEEFGACGCNANTTALAFKAACSSQVVIEDKTITCTGARMCSLDGALGKCETVEPGPEKCDGLDNDCNGKTDDGACDDDNGCTTDSCDVSKGCEYAVVADGLPCDADGTVCTENDSCAAGKCQSGKIKVCDDKNPCTQDTCLPASGCTQTVDDGVPCDDENPCTVGDVCGDGSFTAGKPKKCDSGQPCVDAVCDLTDGGKCAFSDTKKGSGCDDGDKCTGADVCDSGKCVGDQVSCDDQNPCTIDACDKKSGKCANSPESGACSDGDACTVEDACQAGKCAAGKPKSCDDGQSCTADSCDKATGCVMKAKSGNCDDGDACTVGDTCEAGKCNPGKALTCNDNKFCTADSCDNKSVVCISPSRRRAPMATRVPAKILARLARALPGRRWSVTTATLARPTSATRVRAAPQATTTRTSAQTATPAL